METKITHIAALIGDPMRAKILWSLLDGRAYTATELSIMADTSPQNISMHLAKLLRAGLLSVEVQGRHRYYTFAREEVAYAIEAMASLVPAEKTKHPAGDIMGDPAGNLTGDLAGNLTGDIMGNSAVDMQPIRFCRTCYDHLAGRVGVLIAESLLRQELIRYQQQDGLPVRGIKSRGRGERTSARGKISPGRIGRSPLIFEVTEKGILWFGKLGIDCGKLQQQRRAFSRPCLDWTERKHHLAGSLGAALLEKMLEAHWLRRTAGSRAMVVTAKGRQSMDALFKINA